MLVFLGHFLALHVTDFCSLNGLSVRVLGFVEKLMCNLNRRLGYVTVRLLHVRLSSDFRFR